MSDEYSELDGRPNLQKMGQRVKVVGAAVQGVLIVLVTLTLITLLYNAYVSAQTRKELLDCTTPEGACYRESQERSGEVVSGLVVSLKEVVALTENCMEEPSIRSEVDKDARLELLQQCVEAGASTPR